METLPNEFKDCLSRIDMSAAKRAEAIAAHTEVRAYLETLPQFVGWGIDAILIGSYARQTVIHPGNDVDIFSKLTALDTAASPRTVFDAFAAVLTTKYGERATVQRRSVKIAFPADFSVDVVPAVRSGDRWAIPSREQGDWAPGRSWVETDPEGLSALTTEQNQTPSVNGQGAYVPVVKLVRQTREHHLGEAKPGGFYLELATYWAFEKGVSGDSFAEILSAVLGSIRDDLPAYASVPLIDPALGTAYEPQPEGDDLANAASVFGPLAAKAREALGADRCRAAVLWREIVGQNGRGYCFPIPEGCDERGNRVAPVRVNQGRGADEARGFGSNLDT
jgi:hypothetical protein